jgi:ABC-2 type transport system permease protein
MRAANKRSAGGPDRKETAARARRMAEKNADAMPVVEAIEAPKQERVVHAELVDPAPRGGVLEALQQSYVLHLLARRMLAAMYANSLLGLLWSYVQPALRFAVYYAIFGYVFHLHQGTPYFAMHLFTGIVFVHLFSEAWSQATRSIWSNRTLVQKLRLPRELFPIAAMEVAAIHTLPQAILLTVFALIAGWHLSVSAALAGLLGFAIIGSFAVSLGLIFSALNVLYRDFQNIVQTLLQFMHFLVPMMYPFSRIWAEHANHPTLYQIYMSNPVAQGVILLQQLFWNALLSPAQRVQMGVQTPPDMWTRGVITLVGCLLLLVVAQRFFRRLDRQFAERL